jgi:hypothetical protein
MDPEIIKYRRNRASESIKEADKVKSWLKSAKDLIDSTEKIIEDLIANE